MPSIELASVTVTLPKVRGVSDKASNRRQNDPKVRDHILDEITLSIEAGDRLGLIGENGAGKSSLLRVMGGTIFPNKGLVRVQGRPVCLFSIELGMQPELTGRENIFLRGTLLGQSWRNIAGHLDEIVSFSELNSVIDYPIYSYSRGMIMRLAFSISTAFQPEIILLDEWIGAGDERFQRKVRQRMDDLVDNSAITVVASHNRKLLRDVCTVGLWLKEGRVIEFGQIDNILRAYSDYLSTSAS